MVKEYLKLVGLSILTILLIVSMITIFGALMQGNDNQREYIYEWVVVEEIQIRFTNKEQREYFLCNTSMTDTWIRPRNGSKGLFEVEIGEKLTIKWFFFSSWRTSKIMRGWVIYPF